MRLLTTTIATLCLLLASSMAGAYELRLELNGSSADPTNASVGDKIIYDIFLDTQTAVPSNIVLFSVGVQFDPDFVGYNRAASNVEEYYPLYAPKVGKTIPATFLQAATNPPNLWPGDQPPNGDKVININFIEANLNEAQGTSSNEYMGTLVFNAVSAGSTSLVFLFNDGANDYGHIFNVSGVDVSGSVSLVNADGAITVPEPTAAALALGALGAVGVLAHRKRRL